MKRKWLAALLAASLLLSLTGCGGGDSTESTSQTLSQSEQEVTQPVTSEPEYNEDADTIQTAPVKSGTICISGDRGYSTYGFSESNTLEYCRTVSQAARELQGVATVYNIAVPLACGIDFSNAVQEEMGWSNQGEVCDFIYDHLTDGAVAVPIYDTLRQHKTEYLYFRTDHHWTALGAYYAYQQFCQAKGVEPKALEDYETMTFDNFLGSYYEDSGNNPALGNAPDTLVAYLPSSTNDMTFTDRNGTVTPWKVVYDATNYSRGAKYNCFIGGDQPYEEIHNPTLNDGSAVLVVKESFGNAFVPFLVDDYQDVYVVDYRYYNGSINDLCREKGIDDVIFCNNLNATGTPSRISDMQRIL